MKLNKDKFIISEEFKTKQLIKSDKSEIVFFSQHLKSLKDTKTLFILHVLTLKIYMTINI